MNLKEVFRYHNVIGRVFEEAMRYLTMTNIGLNTVKHHRLSAADPSASDRDEEIVKNTYKAADVVSFALMLLFEKERSVKAAEEAKTALDFCVDASVASNKMRQDIARYVKMMMSRNVAGVSEQTGTGYKFNAEGNQTPYLYKIEVENTEDYDRALLKKICRTLQTKADAESEQIDSAMVNTVVDFTPAFDVNDSFEDMMEHWLEVKDEYLSCIAY